MAGMDDDLMTLREAAAAILRWLDARDDHDDEFVIVLAPDERNMFVQFCVHDDGSIYAEAKGNYYALSPDDWLGAAQLSLLEILGWEPPSIDPDAAHFNHWREWPVGTSSVDIANALLDTLLAVYMHGCGEGTCVEMKFGRF
jgi:hypothetical protein